MQTYTGTSINHVYPSIVQSVMVGGEDISPFRAGGLEPIMGQVHNANKEVRKVAIELLDGRRRVNSIRPINLAFALAEVLWIVAGRSDTEMVSHYNKQMLAYSDDGGSLHGAYGARLYYNDQLGDAVQKLQRDRNSRQAVLHIGIPDVDCRKVTKDYPCNQYSEMLIRGEKLHWTQHMRSNDIIWGTPYNLIQWGFLHEIVAGWLGAEVGEYCHIINSAHIYERHYAQAEMIYGDFSTDRDIYSYYDPQDYRIAWGNFPYFFSKIMQLESDSRTQPGLNILNCPELRELPEAWQNFMLVIGAYNAYLTKEHDEEVLEMLDSITNEFKPLLARQFVRIPREQRYATIPVEVLANVIDPLETLIKKEK